MVICMSCELSSGFSCGEEGICVFAINLEEGQPFAHIESAVCNQYYMFALFTVEFLPFLQGLCVS